MRIIGAMVMRNEADRYLQQSLSWLRRTCDAMYVYDDRSSDRSVDVAGLAGANVKTRRPSAPSFREDESAFRQAAWDWMSEAGELTEDDWVLCIDADEFLVQIAPALPTTVRHQSLLVGLASAGRPITFPVAEIFALRDGELMRRTDGYWGSITARRFAPWAPEARFAANTEGGGSLPAEVMKAPDVASTGLGILHLGYADASDRQAKFQRYIQGRGHNRAHVESIVRTPILQSWVGQVPEVL